jgi:hypothetical protein
MRHRVNRHQVINETIADVDSRGRPHLPDGNVTSG